MSENNIKFTSNIEPVNGDIRFDTSFHNKVHDLKALEEMKRQHIPLTPEQHKEYNSWSVPCVYVLEKNDYVFGSSIDDSGNRVFNSRCTNYDCKSFPECRSYNEFSDDELLPWLDNEDYKDLLAYSDAFLEIARKTENKREENELGVEITDDGLVITTKIKKTGTSIPDIYSPIDSITRLEGGLDITTLLPNWSERLEKRKRTPLKDLWSTPDSFSPQENRNICTVNTMRIIRAKSAIESRKIKDNSRELEELRQSMEGGKLKAGGYYEILEEIRKDIAFRGKVNQEYKELSNKLHVQTKPLSNNLTSYGSHVTVKDLSDDKEYSFELLGEEDARFLEDHKIIPYTSKLGSALCNLRVGDQIRISFYPGEEYHTCMVIQINASDYLHL